MKIKRRTFTKWLLGLFALPWIPVIAGKDKDPCPPLTRLSNAVNDEPTYLIDTDGPEWISWEVYLRTHKGKIKRGRLDTFRFVENHRNL